MWASTTCPKLLSHDGQCRYGLYTQRTYRLAESMSCPLTTKPSTHSPSVHLSICWFIQSVLVENSYCKGLFFAKNTVGWQRLQCLLIPIFSSSSWVIYRTSWLSSGQGNVGVSEAYLAWFIKPSTYSSFSLPLQPGWQYVEDVVQPRSRGSSWKKVAWPPLDYGMKNKSLWC